MNNSSIDLPTLKKIQKYKNKTENLIKVMREREIIDQIYDNQNDNMYLMFITGKLVEKINNVTMMSNTHNTYNTTELSETSNKSKKRKFNMVTDQSMVQENNQNDNQVNLKRQRKVPQKYSDYILNLTPAIKSYVYENQRESIFEELKDDQILIDRLEAIVESKDPTHLFYENKGKLIECWIADNLECPVCKEMTLRRYYRDNFPTIDLVCINNNHVFSNGVKFFQVKTTLANTYFNGSKYFDLTDRYIHVGSRKYGEIVHSIRIDDEDINKKILIGYICIEFSEGTKFIKVLKESFIVLPKTGIEIVSKNLFTNLDYYDFDQPDQSDQSDHSNQSNQYYNYITDTSESSQIITFNEKFNQVSYFYDIYDTYYDTHNNKINPVKIPLNYIQMSNWKMIENPLNILKN